jgi:hypothetical protein
MGVSSIEAKQRYLSDRFFQLLFCTNNVITGTRMSSEIRAGSLNITFCSLFVLFLRVGCRYHRYVRHD